MLRRKVTKVLEAWAGSSRTKALLVTGARQIGKSYSIRELGKTKFGTYIELNLYENKRARSALLAAKTASEFVSRVWIF